MFNEKKYIMAKEELVEIKKDMVGHGLLIDNDGYVTLNEGRKNIALKESIDGANEWYVPHPFIVSAVFQKFGIKNANGRIYPEEVLKREVEKYQEKIKEHRALGECYKPDALVLTEEGWKTLEDVKEGENVLTLNTDTMQIEIKPILRKIEKDWNGDMIHIQNRNIDDVVTPNHEYILLDRDGSYWGRCTAEDILERRVKTQDKKYIPRKGEWVGRNDEYFIIENLCEERVSKMHSNNQEKYSSDIRIPMKTFAKFMGIYLSEGCTDKREDGYRVQIYQKKKDIVDKIHSLMDELSLPYTIEERKCEDNSITYVFTICDMRLSKYLRQFGTCYEKYIPFELKQQNKDVLREFYDWFVLGDGRIRGDQRYEKQHLTDDVFSTSKRLALDLNEIQLKIGYCGSFHVENRNIDRNFGERVIKAENSHDMYFTLRSTIKHGVTLDKRFLNVTKEHYEGKVMCIEVENHNFYVMCNNKCHWTSNCNHPADTTINLSRVSHNITELHWEGHTLVGEMELNTSEGFRKHGIVTTCGDEVANLLMNGYKIGVSSRGCGSVESRLGQYIVGEDFELIAVDVVSDPSTPNAYISVNGKEELTPYIENNNVNSTKNQLLEDKLKKINNLLS